MWLAGDTMPLAAFGQVRDDALGAALSDASAVAMSRRRTPGVVGDAQQDPRMFGEEAPLRYGRQV